jgi:dienelactone hydrolase
MIRQYSPGLLPRFLTGIFLLGFAACSGSSTGSNEFFDEPGPYVAGVTTLSLADREVEIWYPADPGAEEGVAREEYFIRSWLPPVIDGLLDPDANPPFVEEAYRDIEPSQEGGHPTVIFAHGFSAFRTQSTFLTAHLASWGFVVVSVDYLERGLASALGFAPENPIDDVTVTRLAVDALATASATPDHLLAGVASTEQLVIVGHSAGAGTATRFAAEPDVLAYVPMTGGGSRSGDFPERPSLWIAGAIDISVPLAGIQASYETAPGPKRLLVLDRGGHLAVSDLCAIGEEEGGIIDIATNAGLPVPENIARLGTDGCQPEALPVREGWPVVQHAVTSFVREAFGIDATASGMGDSLIEHFSDVGLQFEQVGN